MTKGSRSRIAPLFGFCAVFLASGIEVRTLKASVLRSIAVQNESEDKSQDKSGVRTFSGKVVSQNGEHYILRDEVNDVWYHLDDQQQAQKFFGKTVQVKGILDARTDTIRVREITELKA